LKIPLILKILKGEKVWTPGTLLMVKKWQFQKQQITTLGLALKPEIGETLIKYFGLFSKIPLTNMEMVGRI
jgi:hypothetical protein